MNGKCKCVKSKKKCRSNLVIASPKKQEKTQEESLTLNINANTEFSVKRSERNPIFRAYGAHSHEPVQAEMAEGEPRICSACQPEMLIFLNKKIDQSGCTKISTVSRQNGVVVTHPTSTFTDTNNLTHRPENEL